MPDIKTALVTGATRGIGRGIAVRLAERGYGLTIAARREADLERVAEVLQAAGADEVRIAPGDMASEDDIARMVDAHEQSYGSMTALVLAAGVGSAGPIADYPLSRYDKQFAVNTRAAFFAISRALPQLRAAAAAEPVHGSRIVALASIGGIYAEPGLAAYGAAKAALLSICRSVNVEESAGGVSATAIAPAYVDTDMSAWVQGEIPPETMISVADVVEMAEALLRMSARAVVPEIVVSRAGPDSYRA
ncbi:SDR family oxidoreductase [Blastococcus saxobsidens]|uniref:SDR family oxidoreductase n=1 Tax=Blastococcus saxobsidens TaxID=138336 RepID=A0A6L9VZJ6_9ACTN|nr:SDR family oxidoreductase [Blastococcus saxobsidens]NEK85226.1 SDR family oxidoreductase [Blastococcus saxobsidens]